MSQKRNQSSTNGLGEEIKKITEADTAVTNNEIAQQLDAQVSTVRDVRDDITSNQRNKQGESISAASKQTRFDASGTGVIADSALSVRNERFNQSLSDSGSHVLDMLQDPVVKLRKIGDECVIHGVNRSFVNMFDYPESKLIGTSLEEAILPESPDVESCDCAPSDSIDGGREIVSRMTGNGRRDFIRRDIHDESDSEEYVYRIYTDISDHRKRERTLSQRVSELEEENKKLREKSEQLEQFSSILSHDLRNPINIAEGYLGQIKTEENAEDVEVIERALSRVDALIDDTLTLKDEANPVEEYEERQISRIAESAWELVETGESELRVVDSFDIDCDPDRLARLFENMFRNAIDHNEDPVTIRVGVHDTVTTSTRGDTEKGFYISDDGCGIPEDKRDELREIGQTTTREGTGLGLAIIERTAKAHGWGMQLTDSFNDGLKVIFTSVDID